VVAAATWIGVFATGSAHAFVQRGVPVLLVPFALWLFFSERYELTLGVLLVFLGAIDGLLRDESGSTLFTLARDLLLYAVALGALVRLVVRRRPVSLPPFTGLVLLWVLVCVVQLANPVNTSELHAAAGLRQHLEFVPLFFLGYAVLRTPSRLAGLLMLLLVVAAANGIASIVEAAAGPTAVASWGPGFANEVHGAGSQAGGLFVAASGQLQLRPPGLGDSYGFGGFVGLMAVPGAVALLGVRALGATRRWLVAPLLVAAILAVVASQARSAIVGACIGLVAFLALTLTSRRGLAALALTAVVGALGYGVLAQFDASHANRYSTIAPSRFVHTAVSARQATVALIPTYAVRYPLGAGIGSVGPAGGSGIGGGPGPGSHLDAESEFTFLEIETGLPGLAAMLALTVTFLAVGLRLRRVADPRLQRPLAAITAVWVVLSLDWFFGAVSANTPNSPFIWVTAGALAYWYREVRRGRVAVRPRRLGMALAR